MKQILFTIIAIPFFMACNNTENGYDATGTFEAVETIVSAEANGTIKALAIAEGQQLTRDRFIGYIDTIPLSLKKEQLEAQIKATLSKKPNIETQIAAYKEQLKQARHEQQRMNNLVKADAATRKQLDDANAQVNILQKQLDAAQSALSITASSLNEDSATLNVQIRQLNDQLKKSRIINPVNGTVLTKYAEPEEMASIGKPLYKIADLSSIILRAYITGDQFSQIKLNEKVTVYTNADTKKSYPGTVEWISSKAEFTPKTIQTKDERANLVYAVKIKVSNDGLLKIGMYGDVKFKHQN
ncbi:MULTISPECIES: HlyD family efflux transporter periplasmic adaptor subunit [unclassified Flavobacterium]|uniref:HlyD family secretion protein n=1 Tax=unclassified Flavobacterium TaxID=196869 RepID=UPI00086B4180|nr:MULTISPECIES: HlyD family efflux transporter periplasmic adaptor subunit [unclassified Flavobacterium]MBN9286059.1 HlyD family efflux transporter periplasmic adaptor subunit [Flavobacterium sp.]ODS90258.1 MAG: secretion protein [Chryseobacterium sp. SCN 40-13]OJV68409.1 MAG: HlyD family secretion protein [Flavobacterium sp. 40-81]